MKNIYIIIMLVFFLTSGCEKFLDVNHNPNVTEDSRLDLVLPSGIEQTAQIFGNSFNSLGGIWAQHWTSDINNPGYMGEDAYNVQAGDYSYDLRGWSSLYPGPLMDFEWVKTRATETGNWNYFLMATVMQCYTYQIMVDLWDQIPVSDALMSKPATFENGADVYDILINRIDEALAKDFNATTNTKVDKDDLVFNGNIASWKAFANTLKLKIFLRQRFARPDVSLEKITNLINSDALFLTEDAAFTDFSDEPGKGNFWYESNLRSSDGALRASRTLFYFIESDIRLDYIYRIYEEGGVHDALWQGDFRNKFDSYGSASTPKFSVPITKSTSPTYFISKTETIFLLAEAAFIMNKPASELEELYIAGIEADCDRHDIPSDVDRGKIYDPTIGEHPFPISGSSEEQFKALMMQKWVAMANGQGLEAFFDFNRTGIPNVSEFSPGDEDWNEDNYVPGEFTVSVQGAGILVAPNSFPKRLLFPSTEKSKNPNTPTTVEIHVPVWWDVN